jgi:hypothetical protein
MRIASDLLVEQALLPKPCNRIPRGFLHCPQLQAFKPRYFRLDAASKCMQCRVSFTPVMVASASDRLGDTQTDRRAAGVFLDTLGALAYKDPKFVLQNPARAILSSIWLLCSKVRRVTSCTKLVSCSA